MNTKLFRFSAVAALLLSLTLLAGCLQFQNKLDLSDLPVKGETLQATFDAPDEWPDDNLGDVNIDELDNSAAEPVTNGAEPVTDSSGETVATEPVSDETPSENATAAPAMSVAEYVGKLGTTQYDILRSNRFSIVAKTTEGNEVTNMKLARGDKKAYVVTDMDGIELGVYITGSKTYLYYPKAKKYMELTDSIVRMIGMDPKEFAAMADEMGFDDLPPLSSAQSMENATVNGVACKVFHFSKQSSGGRAMNAYLNGRKLIRLEYLDDAGKVRTSMDFTSISAGFPQMPPSGYSKAGSVEFVALLAKDMT